MPINACILQLGRWQIINSGVGCTYWCILNLCTQLHCWVQPDNLGVAVFYVLIYRVIETIKSHVMHCYENLLLQEIWWKWSVIFRQWTKWSQKPWRHLRSMKLLERKKKKKYSMFINVPQTKPYNHQTLDQLNMWMVYFYLFCYHQAFMCYDEIGVAGIGLSSDSLLQDLDYVI